MIHRTSVKFWKEYEGLPQGVRASAIKQFALLKRTPHHPSLHFEKVSQKNGQEIWSARVTLDYRALALRRGDEFVWFWIGAHRPYESFLS